MVIVYNSNVSSAPNHHIRMMSEGSFDTQDCSNVCITPFVLQNLQEYI